MRVYLSSTYGDLREVRAAAREIVGRRHAVAVGMEDYGADARPTSARCRADVESCQAYVLLLGWRYGSPAPETSAADPGRRLSFTELEYEAALDARVPVLAYELAPNEAWRGPPERLVEDPDLGPIRAFRARVQAAHLTRACTSLHELREHLLNDLANEAPRLATVPELLPFTCNREEQRRRLRKRLEAARRPEGWEPVVAVAHGAAEQALDRFLECVSEVWLPALWQGRAGLRCRRIDLAWTPTPPHDPLDDLLQQLSGDKPGFEGVASAADVRVRLAAAAVPVVADLPVSHDRWTPRDDRRLLALADLFGAPGPLLPSPALALAWVPYRTTGGGWWRRRAARRTEADILRALERLKAERPHVEVLPRLADVTRDDVERWRTSPEFRQRARHLALDDARLGPALEARAALPMRRMAEVLRGALRPGP